MSENESVILEEKIVVLKKPFVLKDKTISELKLREPTALELEAAEEAGKKGDTARTIMLVSLVSGVHHQIIKGMLGSDLARCAKIISGFLDIGQEDGET